MTQRRTPRLYTAGVNRRALPLLLGLLLCCDGQGPVPTPGTEAAPPAYEPLNVDEQLLRISMALRGVRPSVEEYEEVSADPGALAALVDRFLSSEEFAETIRDMHAEVLLLRTEILRLPPRGELEGELLYDIHDAMAEEPLRLVSAVVMDDRPYTEIVTSDTTQMNRLGQSIWAVSGHDGSDSWQEVQWDDGRPGAGILSSSNLWVRHESSGANFHRGRANLIASALLCRDFIDRDVPITGTVDLSDEEAVAEAVNTQPECVSCHQALDPLAGNLWGMGNKMPYLRVVQSYNGGCSGSSSANCYPISYFNPDHTDGAEYVGLREPGYFGLPTSGYGDLGQAIADDPRFSLCTAQRFYGYLAQIDIDEVPLEVATRLQTVLLDSDFSARALTREIVLSEEFLARDVDDEELRDSIPGVLVIRPEQVSRMIEDLTGFVWAFNVDDFICLTQGECWGDRDGMHGDGFGFRAMAGGIDSFKVTLPVHTPTPVKALFSAAMAQEAAGWTVDHDLLDTPKLLTAVTGSTTDEAAIRDQLVLLHLRILGERLATDDEEIDETLALWSGALARNDDDVAEAWKVVLTAMLQDIRVVFY